MDEALFVYRPARTRQLRKALRWWLLPVVVVGAGLYARYWRDVPPEGVQGAFLGAVVLAASMSLLGWASDRAARRTHLVVTSEGSLVTERHPRTRLGRGERPIDAVDASELTVAVDEAVELTEIEVRRPGGAVERAALAGAMDVTDIRALYAAMTAFAPGLRLRWTVAVASGLDRLLPGRWWLRERGLHRLRDRLDEYREDLEAAGVEVSVVVDVPRNCLRIEVAEGHLDVAEEILSELRSDGRVRVGAAT